MNKKILRYIQFIYNKRDTLYNSLIFKKNPSIQFIDEDFQLSYYLHTVLVLLRY